MCERQCRKCKKTISFATQVSANIEEFAKVIAKDHQSSEQRRKTLKKGEKGRGTFKEVVELAIQGQANMNDEGKRKFRKLAKVAEKCDWQSIITCARAGRWTMQMDKLLVSKNQ